MAVLPNTFSISFDVEPIVKLLCEDTECLYHLVKKSGGWMACDLKHITIQRGGMCASRLTSGSTLTDGSSPVEDNADNQSSAVTPVGR